MKTTPNSRRFIALILVLSLLLACTACGGGTRATTMRLRKTNGKVSVSDDAGKDVETARDLALYSGYQVKTRSDSYAWIDLDEVKLAKLDQQSRVDIQKDGKELELNLRSGSVFFNVTEPLADDETMEIRTSTMTVGIRGTCGWVVCEEDTAQVCILEGKVRCRASGAETVNVSAGEMAVLEQSEGETKLEVRALTGVDIPDFVIEELTEDRDILWQGHRYQIISESMNWREAEEYCQSLGGHLASITTAAEQALITCMLENEEKNFFWLGGTDEEEEGEWVWTNGEEWSYTNWGIEEPNGGRGENYLAIVNKGRFNTLWIYEWNDFSITGSVASLSEFGFICEWNENS